jgi:hypothetical protein
MRSAWRATSGKEVRKIRYFTVFILESFIEPEQCTDERIIV